MKIPKLIIKKKERIDNEIVLNIEGTLLDENIIDDSVFIGIDPGVTNIGIAKVISGKERGSLLLHQIHMERKADPIDRMKYLSEFMHSRIYVTGMETLIIEGASFAKHYRQVELSEARTVIAMWGIKMGMNVKIVPPNTIRKVAFGSAKIINPWDEQIDDDVAAALGCAIYGYKNIK